MPSKHLKQNVQAPVFKLIFPNSSSSIKYQGIAFKIINNCRDLMRDRYYLPFLAITVAIPLLAYISLPAPYKAGFLSMKNFNHRKSQYTGVPNGSLHGKTALVTGGNSGIGLETARALAKGGAKVYLTSRSLDRATKAKQLIVDSADGVSLHIQPLQLDLSDLDDVDKVTQTILDPIDILVLNAGALPKEVEMTRYGYESLFATHYLGHFYLANKVRLLPGSRVIIVSSALSLMVDSINWESLTNKEVATRLGIGALYSQSKHANNLLALELQKNKPEIMVAVTHPGMVDTPIVSGDRSMLKSLGFLYNAAEGAAPTLLGAVAQNLPKPAFILPTGIVATPSEWAASMKNEVEAKKLWTYAEDIIARHNAKTL